MRRIHRRRGSHLVEFALVFPVFWLLLAGMIDWGWLFYHRQMLDRAANAGCRSASLIDPGVDESAVPLVAATAQASMVNELERSGIECDSNTCTTDVYLTGDPPGRTLVCEVSYYYEPLLGVAVDEGWMRSGIGVRMEWQRWP